MNAAIFRDEKHAIVHRVLRRIRPVAFVTEMNLAAILTEVSEQRAQQRCPPASRQPDDAKHLAAKSFERHIGELGSHREFLNGERRFRFLSGRLLSCVNSLGPVRSEVRPFPWTAAKHRRNEGGHIDFFGRCLEDDFALAQARHRVAHREDFGEMVGDDHDSSPARGDRPEYAKQSRDLLAPKRRGRLVENENLTAEAERPRDLDQLLLDGAHVRSDRRKELARDGEFLEQRCNLDALLAHVDQTHCALVLGVEVEVVEAIERPYQAPALA